MTVSNTNIDFSSDPLANVAIETMPRFLGAALDYPAETVIDWHDHDVAQVIYAVSGAMRVRTAADLLIVPPTMAVWVAHNTQHRIAVSSAAAMRTLYVRQDVLRFGDERCRILVVTPLLRELVLAVMPVEIPTAGASRLERLFDLLIEELHRATELPLRLPLPEDRRIRPIAEKALADPGAITTISEWLAEALVSTKTAERLFRKDTGFTPSQWLRQARLMTAVEWLAEGRSVTSVALDLGYVTASAFTYMFRCSLGAPPIQFLKGGAHYGKKSITEEH